MTLVNQLEANTESQLSPAMTTESKRMSNEAVETRRSTEQTKMSVSNTFVSPDIRLRSKGSFLLFLTPAKRHKEMAVISFEYSRCHRRSDFARTIYIQVGNHKYMSPRFN